MTPPTRPANLAERICAWGVERRDTVAIDDHGDVWSYGRLARQIELWAGRLHARGLGRGDTLLLFVPQTAAAVAAYFGAMRCGAAPSFMPLPSAKQDSAYYWRSHAELLRLIRPAALLTLVEPLDLMRAAGFAELTPQLLAINDDWPEVPAWTGVSPGDEDDIALLQHSSGQCLPRFHEHLWHRDHRRV